MSLPWRRALLPTPLGPLVAVSAGGTLRLLEFADERARLERQLRRLGLCEPGRDPAGSDLWEQLQAELTEYFAGARERFDVPWRLGGTPFQQAVWAQVAAVPFGRTRSYGEVATALGRPGAARAVGHANGANPLAIVIPCHRLVGGDGSLRGYGGGLARKRALLDLERSPAATRRRSGERETGSGADGS